MSKSSSSIGHYEPNSFTTSHHFEENLDSSLRKHKPNDLLVSPNRVHGCSILVEQCRATSPPIKTSFYRTPPLPSPSIYSSNTSSLHQSYSALMSSASALSKKYLNNGNNIEQLDHFNVQDITDTTKCCIKETSVSSQASSVVQTATVSLHHSNSQNNSDQANNFIGLFQKFSSSLQEQLQQHHHHHQLPYYYHHQSPQYGNILSDSAISSNTGLNNSLMTTATITATTTLSNSNNNNNINYPNSKESQSVPYYSTATNTTTSSSSIEAQNNNDMLNSGHFRLSCNNSRSLDLPPSTNHDQRYGIMSSNVSPEENSSAVPMTISTAASVTICSTLSNSQIDSFHTNSNSIPYVNSFPHLHRNHSSTGTTPTQPSYIYY